MGGRKRNLRPERELLLLARRLLRFPGHDKGSGQLGFGAVSSSPRECVDGGQVRRPPDENLPSRASFTGAGIRL